MLLTDQSELPAVHWAAVLRGLGVSVCQEDRDHEYMRNAMRRAAGRSHVKLSDVQVSMPFSIQDHVLPVLRRFYTVFAPNFREALLHVRDWNGSLFRISVCTTTVIQ